jgi:hypothetical protein
VSYRASEIHFTFRPPSSLSDFPSKQVTGKKRET